MTAIGKLLALLLFVVGLALLTWAVGVYGQRPGWFGEPPEGGVDKGHNPVTFKGLKAEIDGLNRGAAVASDLWGTNLKALEETEKLRADRRKGYALRLQWAKTGNPRDLNDPANPKSGTGFYAPVVDPKLNLYDLSLDATGKPKGEPILSNEGKPLPGLSGLLASVAGDVKEIEELVKQTAEQRALFDELSKEVIATERKVIAMNTIRDSIQGELFFLSTFEANVYETRATVLRREDQLRKRLRALGVIDP
jgi:hypothetical protein